MAMPAGVTAATVIKKYIEVVGGTSKLKSVKDISITAAGQYQGIKVQWNKKHKLPGKYTQDILVPSFNVEIHQTMIGDSAVVWHHKELSPVTNIQKVILQQSATVFPELNYLSSAYQLVLGPSILLMNDQPTYQVAITTPTGLSLRNYYDLKTGLKLKEVIELPDGSSVKEFTDYRDAGNGIKIPHLINSSIAGPPIDYKITEVKINSNLTDPLFQ